MKNNPITRFLLIFSFLLLQTNVFAGDKGYFKEGFFESIFYALLPIPFALFIVGFIGALIGSNYYLKVYMNKRKKHLKNYFDNRSYEQLNFQEKSILDNYIGKKNDASNSGSTMGATIGIIIAILILYIMFGYYLDFFGIY